LLHATNRLGEAESLYRPALAIFLIFQRKRPVSPVVQAALR
jgi:hypothetical protein